MTDAAAGPVNTADEREITEPVALLLPNGRQNPDAIGWTRHQLHNTDSLGRGLYAWGRNKRWEYWGITTPTHVIALTIAGLDFASLHQLWVLDRRTLTPIDTVVIGPLGRNVTLPGTLGTGPSRARGKRLSIDMDEVDGGTRLRAESARVRLDVIATIPENHEAPGTSSPFSDRLAQYTVKDVDRPTVGRLWVDGEEFAVPAGESWAVLDHARARSPYGTHWNWGAGAGLTDGKRIGLQLGGGGKRCRGPSQNAFTVDGRVHKVAELLNWEYDTDDWLAPWRIHSARVDLTFTPFYDRFSTMNFVVIGSRTHQCFGHYSGWLRDDAGERIRVDGVVGWAEDVHNRW
ncbi:DUF2804 domain-containing protein [Leifsonia kafniensis]|uniref:DUF2804 domain-containing protein n=1 Tax=Leifsonia kafniensis TaxID=475957 RepID=A0ABP7KYM4_9MICO